MDKIKSWIQKNKFINIVRNNVVESIVAVVCFIIFVYLITTKDESIRGNGLYNLFSVFVTFIFTWISAKFSCIYQYEKENKKYATTAYRHNRNLITKIDYFIKVIDNIIRNRTQCGGSGNICQNKENLFRLRDSLISFKEDAQENLGDWTNLIASDISKMEKARKEYEKYKIVQDSSQDEDNPVEEDSIQNARNAYESAYNDLTPEFRIIFDNEIKIADEMNTYVEEEMKLQMKANNADVYKKMAEIFAPTSISKIELNDK